MLAISNYFTFRENAVYEAIDYLTSFQKQINKYLTNTDNSDTINAMLVITAPMQHQRDDD